MSPSTKRKNDQNEKVVINTINPSHVTVYETRTQMHHHIQKSGKSVHVWGSTGPKCFANSYLPPPLIVQHPPITKFQPKIRCTENLKKVIIFRKRD